ncbi:MAG: thermophilic metalloprotease [Caudoviricetes sp.]|nr:MAG: thermophilic metalloprotease [Caudoviricetes sp.]
MEQHIFDELLTNYAKLAVNVGMNVQEGQQVIIRAPIEAVQLVRKVTDEAYKKGASVVTTLYEDDYTILSKYKNAYGDAFDKVDDWLINGQTQGYKDGAARLVILGRNPTLLKDVDTSLISRQAKARAPINKELMKLVTSSHSQWSIISYVTDEWAKQVFPNETVENAVSRLWKAIFSACRVYENPIKEWENHNEKLSKLCDWMNEKQFDSLQYISPNTHLIVGLAEDHVWEGGAGLSESNIPFNANIPTEEIFTTPHKDKVDGVVVSTKPLLYRGNMIDGIKVRFEKGKAVEYSSLSGEKIFKDMLEEDEGASRLGEVAIVPHSSPISRSGIVFKETLFDENASCHFAFGQSYKKCMKELPNQTDETLYERGANNSQIHVDWMVGSKNLSIYGIKDDEETLIFENGEWVI